MPHIKKFITHYPQPLPPQLQPLLQPQTPRPNRLLHPHRRLLQHPHRQAVQARKTFTATSWSLTATTLSSGLSLINQMTMKLSPESMLPVRLLPPPAPLSTTALNPRSKRIIQNPTPACATERRRGCFERI